MLDAQLMSWAEFEAELIEAFGPDFGPAIANRVVAERPARNEARGRAGRSERSSPRRL